jgi:acyl carrier protein
MTTLEKIQNLVADSGIELKEGRIIPDKSFSENGIDSLDTMTLFLSIEETFGIKFTDEEVEAAKTFDDIIILLGKHT